MTISSTLLIAVSLLGVVHSGLSIAQVKEDNSLGFKAGTTMVTVTQDPDMFDSDEEIARYQPFMTPS